MAVEVNYTLNRSAAIADAAHWPTIRRLTLDLHGENGPVLPPAQSKTTGAWEVASPETVPRWSAVCYLSAVEMLRAHCEGSSTAAAGEGELRAGTGSVCDEAAALPLGLIQVAVGATPMENWMSAEALRDCGGRPFPNIHPGSASVWASSWWWDRLIKPLTNTSIRAVLWYQGEDNALGESRPEYSVLASSRWDFAHCFRSLISSWREAWMRKPPRHR